MNTLKELDRILNNNDITTVFQPIISLKDGHIIGYEALSRGPKGSPLELPKDLFFAARKHNKLWDLEFLCRIKAIEKSHSIDKNKLLFLNVDPLIMKDPKFQKGFTKEFLATNNLLPKTIIFEITEKTAIDDYSSFKSTLENYVDQGYQIAIDDCGSGYSGLITISKTRPNYLKIDIALIKDIDSNSFNQAIIKTLVSLSKTTKMKLIAEGVETEQELKTLIDLGVYACQGYFLCKPAKGFLSLSDNIKNKIINYNKLLEDKYDYSNNHIGQIASKEMAFSSETICQDLKEYFASNPIEGVCIIKDDYPVGLVMEHTLNEVLATQYGVAVFSKRPISLVMDTAPLIVDYNASINEVSSASMERNDHNLYDYVIVTKEDKYYGMVTIKKLLQFTTELERNYARQLNPLTGLPGNTIIEKTLKNLLTCERNFCVLYFDLDNFKAYNDTYGFENGDKILNFTSNLIQQKIKHYFPFNSFIGHIGGDDFVCVIETTLENAIKASKDMIYYFDKNVLEFFNEKDRLNGYIICKDRKGHKDTFPLTSISIAGLYGNFTKFNSPDEIGQEITKIKKDLKLMKYSNYSIDNININTNESIG